MVMKYRVWHIKEERYLKDDMGIIDSPVNVFVAPNGKAYQLVECLMAGIILQDITDDVIIEWGVEFCGMDHYEGDRVRDRLNTHVKGIVVFELSQFVIKSGNGHFGIHHAWEVIGTIHDKELDNDR